MANVIIRGHTSQTPTGPVTLRAGHPLAKGLAVFVPLNGMRPYRNLVNGALPDASTQPSGTLVQTGRYPGRLGGHRIGTVFNGSSHYLRYPLPIAQGWPWTMAAGLISNTSATGWKASGTAVSVCAAASANFIYCSGSRILRFTSYASPNLNAFSGAAQGNYRDTLRTAGRIRSATDRAFCIDHSQMVVDTSSSNSTADQTHFTIGCRYSNGTVDYYGDALEYAMLWSRGLADDELREITLAPWQITARDPRRVWFVPSAGGGVTLAVADAAHGHSVDNLSLSQAATLAMQDAAHGHAVDNLTLVQQHLLAVADALHGHAVDNVVLSQAISLTVAEALHAHTVDNVALVQANILAVAEALHAHAAEAPALTQANTLAAQDATHGHAADNVTLSAGNTLAVAEATHGHSADNLNLTQANVLVVQETAHGHTVDNVTLSYGLTLAVADALHAHAVDGLTLTQGYLLGVQDATHAHTADAPTLTQASVLIVSDALHAQLVDAISLQLPGMGGAPASRTIVVQAASRTILVTRSNRTITVH